MTLEEKAAAFDIVADVFVCRYHDGRYAWFCLNPAGGEKVDTPEQAVTDFLKWIERAKRWKYKSHLNPDTTDKVQEVAATKLPLLVLTTTDQSPDAGSASSSCAASTASSHDG